MDDPRDESLLAWLFSLDDDVGVPPQMTAQIYHVQVDTLATWRSTGKGPRYRKAGRYVDYPAGELKAHLRASVRVPVAASARRLRGASSNRNRKSDVRAAAK